MLLVVLAIQVVLVLLVVVLLLRKPAAPPAADERLLRVPDALVAVHARLQAFDDSTRAGLADLQTRTRAEEAARQLRQEVADSLVRLESKLTQDVVAIHREVQGSLKSTQDLLLDFLDKAGKRDSDAGEKLNRQLRDLLDSNTVSHQALRESVQGKLTDLGQEQRTHHEGLRTTVEGRLDKLNTDNVAKLEEMRATVDEKLHATLQTRLTESFGQVTTHLGEVQKGLGEMKELATGVSDLKKVFSNVKARGIVGEFQLGMQLEQMFSPEQYVKNARIKKNSAEAVEFALKVPDGDNGHVLLPIDAKFPREDWERLEHAYDHGTIDEQAKAGAAFERAIRTEGKRICEKYIDPPTTLPFAVMFLPTEALYAEVMRRPALHTDLQSNCNVTIAGPSSFMAILTSFQMGFRTLAIQKKGSEVWNILGGVKTEFGKFETLMTKVENNVKTVQNTLSDIGVRTRAINRNLRNVTELPGADTNAPLIAFEDIAAVAPLLAASGDE